MHATTLLAQAIRCFDDVPELPPTRKEVCCLTGRHTDCVPRAELIGQSFTDTHLFAAPSSAWIGADVFTAWRYGARGEGKNRDMRPEANQCWWCNGREFRIMRKADMRPIVLDGSPSTPWAMWITTGYKKHGSLRTPVNARKRGRVAFDELVIDCTNGEAVNATWARLNAALAAGITRAAIETLDCPQHIMREVGLPVWMEFEQWARPRFNGGLYRLLTYLLPSKEERGQKNDSPGAATCTRLDLF